MHYHLYLQIDALCCIYLVFLSGRSIPPPNITLDLVEGTSITVKWTPHPQDENFRSESRNFIVRYKKYQSKTDNFKNVTITGWNTWQATLSNLEEGTQYIIQVAATKTILPVFQQFKLTGDYSEPLIVTTDQGEYKVLTWQFTYDRNQYLVCNLIHLCTLESINIHRLIIEVGNSVSGLIGYICCYIEYTLLSAAPLEFHSLMLSLS